MKILLFENEALFVKLINIYYIFVVVLVLLFLRKLIFIFSVFLSLNVTQDLKTCPFLF